MLDMKKIKEDATAELIKEREENAKKRIKAKLRDLDNARIVVANLEREVEDLYAAIADGN